MRLSFSRRRPLSPLRLVRDDEAPARVAPNAWPALQICESTSPRFVAVVGRSNETQAVTLRCELPGALVTERLLDVLQCLASGSPLPEAPATLRVVR